SDVNWASPMSLVGPRASGSRYDSLSTTCSRKFAFSPYASAASSRCASKGVSRASIRMPHGLSGSYVFAEASAWSVVSDRDGDHEATAGGGQYGETHSVAGATYSTGSANSVGMLRSS